jgi:hypothetical protein
MVPNEVAEQQRHDAAAIGSSPAIDRIDDVKHALGIASEQVDLLAIDDVVAVQGGGPARLLRERHVDQLRNQTGCLCRTGLLNPLEFLEDNSPVAFSVEPDRDLKHLRRSDIIMNSL